MNDWTGTEMPSRLERGLEAVLSAAIGAVLAAVVCSSLPSELSHLSRYIAGTIVIISAVLGYRFGRDAVRAIAEAMAEL